MEPNTQPNNLPQNNIPSNASIPPASTVITPQKNESSIGSIIGTIIVIAIIILGGLYFWGKRIDEAKLKQDLVTIEEEVPTPQASDENLEANAIKSVSASDDVTSLEAELNATNFDGLSAELE